MSSLTAVFPLSQAFLPGEWVALRVFEDRYVKMIGDIRQGSIDLCTVLIERGSEIGGGDTRLGHGVRLDIEQFVEDANGLHIGCRAGRIVSINEWLDTDIYPTAVVMDQSVSPLDRSRVSDATVALASTISMCRRLIETLSVREEARDHALNVCDSLLDGLVALVPATGAEERLWKALWLAARMVPCGPLDRYSLLEPGSLMERTFRFNSVIDHVTEVMRFGSLS
jgi:Lon protease-like protein